jgi:hypothetical protein
MSPRKEPRFFALEGDPLDYRGPDDPARHCEFTTLEAYSRLFDGALPQHKAIGEASTLYLYHPDAPERIRHYIPDVRLIVILRNPAERAYSNFVFARMQGREPIEDFQSALDAEEKRIEKRWGPLWHYKAKGFYHQQLSRYISRFPSDRIRPFLFDDLSSDRMRFARDVFEFLGVDPEFRPDLVSEHNVSGVPRSRLALSMLSPGSIAQRASSFAPPRLRRNVARFLRRRAISRPPPMPPEVRCALNEIYRSDILRLQDLLDRDLSSWLENTSNGH